MEAICLNLKPDEDITSTPHFEGQEDLALYTVDADTTQTSINRPLFVSNENPSIRDAFHPVAIETDDMVTSPQQRHYRNIDIADDMMISSPQSIQRTEKYNR